MTVAAPGSINARLLADAPDVARAVVTCTQAGVVAGLAEALEALPDGLANCVHWEVREGGHVVAGQPLATVTGSGIELNRVEDHLLGVLGVASGIATRAAALLAAAPAGMRVVCGAWKKLPPAMKPALRAGLDAAGVGHRLLAQEFVYVDKNAVALLGGPAAAVHAGLAVGNGPVALQIKHVDECDPAVAAGASVLMVDTGDLADLVAIRDRLRLLQRSDVLLAFGGGVTGADLPAIDAAGASIVDIGRAILDAPLLDLRLDVVPPKRAR